MAREPDQRIEQAKTMYLEGRKLPGPAGGHGPPLEVRP